MENDLRVSINCLLTFEDTCIETCLIDPRVGKIAKYCIGLCLRFSGNQAREFDLTV
jgi:hypothetical protein